MATAGLCGARSTRGEVVSGHRTHSTAVWARKQCTVRAPVFRYSTDNSAVTCRVCLYHLGFYVPLSKLREHQGRQALAAFERAYPC
jgi:hypothetical protein